VPDFSGTAHSYIGCTLAAANVDRRTETVHACPTRTTQPYSNRQVTPPPPNPVTHKPRGHMSGGPEARGSITGEGRGRGRGLPEQQPSVLELG
jgi:hypothetical protein